MLTNKNIVVGFTKLILPLAKIRQKFDTATLFSKIFKAFFEKTAHITDKISSFERIYLYLQTNNHFLPCHYRSI